MIAKPDVRVAPVTDAIAPAVRALRVVADQVAYVGNVAFNVTNASADPNSDAMAVLVGDRVVGFYRLDYAPTIVARKKLCAASVGLRAFMLDRDWQGRGLGTLAITACCADVQRRRPERRLMALNVNCRNVGAINAYRKAGFVDTGELYLGGSAGPQHLMVRELRVEA